MMKRSELTGKLSETQSGIALISAMLVLALVSVLAVTYVQRQRLIVAAFGHGLHFNQLQHNLLISEQWAQHQLAKQVISINTREASQAELDLSPLQFESGKVRGRLVNLSGRFNVNNLVFFGVDELQQRQAFINICQGAGISQTKITKLLTRLNELSPLAAKGQVHLFHWQELVSEQDLTSSQAEALGQMLVALPRVTRVDVNYVSASTLEYLLPFISDVLVDELLAQRAIAPFESIEELYRALEHLGVDMDPEIKQKISSIMGVSSQYFQLHLSASLGDTTSAITSWLELLDTNKVGVYARTMGSIAELPH
jgi:general secretion pathway protein K